jgi:hypothetical protein
MTSLVPESFILYARTFFFVAFTWPVLRENFEKRRWLYVLKIALIKKDSDDSR